LIPNPLDYAINIFNEVAASLYLYFMIMLTDFHGENTHREEIGWALLALVCGTVLINIIKTAIVSYSAVKRSLILGYKKLRSLVRPSQPSTIAIKPEIVK
jgi:hypothetical protein